MGSCGRLIGANGRAKARGYARGWWCAASTLGRVIERRCRGGDKRCPYPSGWLGKARDAARSGSFRVCAFRCCVTVRYLTSPACILTATGTVHAAGHLKYQCRNTLKKQAITVKKSEVGECCHARSATRASAGVARCTHLPPYGGRDMCIVTCAQRGLRWMSRAPHQKNQRWGACVSWCRASCRSECSRLALRRT